mmetsp:Transcript_458/g.1198  ORF Transcript_458/g.1198 Transcript_458/m.1198 type:complete len:292 (-) Transcript_458:108-983(-)
MLLTAQRKSVWVDMGRVCRELQRIRFLQRVRGYALNEKLHWSNGLAEMVDRQNAIAEQLCAAGGKVGKDETGAVAYYELVVEHKSLKVLSFSGSRGHRHALVPHNRVDCGAFAYVRITDHSYNAPRCHRVLRVHAVILARRLPQSPFLLLFRFWRHTAKNFEQFFDVEQTLHANSVGTFISLAKMHSLACYVLVISLCTSAAVCVGMIALAIAVSRAFTVAASRPTVVIAACAGSGLLLQRRRCGSAGARSFVQRRKKVRLNVVLCKVVRPHVGEIWLEKVGLVHKEHAAL